MGQKQFKKKTKPKQFGAVQGKKTKQEIKGFSFIKQPVKSDYKKYKKIE